MPLYNAFFWGASGFVLGAIIGGAGLAPIGTGAIALMGALVATFALRVRFVVALLPAVALMAGALYYAIDDARYHRALQVSDGTIEITGSVIEEPRRGLSHQSARVRVETIAGVQVRHVRLTIYMEQYPLLAYGDVVHARGRVAPPPDDSYGRFMANHRLAGTLFYPEIEIQGRAGNPIMHALGNVRADIQAILNRHFTQEHSAFLHGILLGNRDEFSREFLNKLSLSGTMHVTALSGLHMAIIVFIMLAIYRRAFLKREGAAFAATFFTVVLFVALTGFKVSAIRASMMAFLVGLAKHTSRTYNPRNALALAALILTLANPKAPVFDIGFQLSFVATFSIIYFAPLFQRFSFFATDGIFAWRTICAITLSAQIGVLPITVLYFSNFSFSMLPANIALLVVLPVVMVFGFATIAAGFLSPALAEVISIPTSFLITYSISVVELFYTLRLPFNPELGVCWGLTPFPVCWGLTPFPHFHWEQYPINEAFAGGGEDGDWANYWMQRGYVAIELLDFSVLHSHYLGPLGWWHQWQHWKENAHKRPFTHLSYRTDPTHAPLDPKK